MKLKHLVKLIPSSLALLLLFSSCDQRKERNVIVDYLSEKPPMNKAELFAAGTMSTDAFEHSAPTFSVDGKTVLWAIMEMPSYKASIMEMNYENGKWATPHLASFSDTTASDIYPSFSPDGKVVYFSSSRILPSGEPPAKGNVIWSVEKTENGWASPQPLDSTISKSGDYAPSIAISGNLYFTYGPHRSPDWNIVMSEKANGLNTERIQLPSTINSNGYEDGPFIAPDESYLIFESDRPGGIDGSIDLYITFKSADGEWGLPLNMGAEVNSSAAERFAKVSPDGKYLFFGSNRRQVNGNPNFDIYWIDTSVIDKLRVSRK